MAGCSAGENQIVVEQQSRDGERWAEPAHRLEEQSHRQEEHFRVLCIFSCVLKSIKHVQVARITTHYSRFSIVIILFQSPFSHITQ